MIMESDKNNKEDKQIYVKHSMLDFRVSLVSLALTEQLDPEKYE